MKKKKKRKIKVCPLCGHNFKNYKWRTFYEAELINGEYISDLASCPHCGLKAVKF
jgi:hypothetical protein